MSKFITNPPVVDAVQWDGTLEGAREIKDFLFLLDRSNAFGVRSLIHGSEIISMIDFGDSFNRMMRKGDWLVISYEGAMEILSDNKFKRIYSALVEE